MQRLSEFYGIVIYMYFQDHNPPHFHAICAEHEALVRIDSGEVIRGRLPKTAGTLVEQWRRLHVEDLMANWERAQVPAALTRIDDDDVFPNVTVDAVARTVTWPEGVDFDPDVLHGDHAPASGTGPKLLREHHREPARQRLP